MKSIDIDDLESLKQEGKKILVDWWAPWCGPCKSLMPRLEALESDYPNVTFVKINADENREDAVSLGIRSLPTIMIFDGEKLIDSSKGAQVNSYYEDILKGL